jgi:hypothetical protein
LFSQGTNLLCSIGNRLPTGFGGTQLLMEKTEPARPGQAGLAANLVNQSDHLDAIFDCGRNQRRVRHEPLGQV